MLGGAIIIDADGGGADTPAGSAATLDDGGGADTPGGREFTDGLCRNVVGGVTPGGMPRRCPGRCIVLYLLVWACRLV
jgi:hypothetical protein